MIRKNTRYKPSDEATGDAETREMRVKARAGILEGAPESLRRAKAGLHSRSSDMAKARLRARLGSRKRSRREPCRRRSEAPAP